MEKEKRKIIIWKKANEHAKYIKKWGIMTEIETTILYIFKNFKSLRKIKVS